MTRKPSKAAKPTVKKPPAKAKAKPAMKAKPAAAKSAKPKATKSEQQQLTKKKAALPSKAAPKAAAPKPSAAKAAKAPRGAKAAKASAKIKRAALQPIGVAKPGLGHKWSCFACGAKFYDLGKPFPVCPKCEADQRDRPLVKPEPAPVPPAAKRPAMPPMSRFLDDDEVAAPEEEFGAPAEEAEEPETTEIDIESLEEPAGVQEGEFTEAEEE